MAKRKGAHTAKLLLKQTGLRALFLINTLLILTTYAFAQDSRYAYLVEFTDKVISEDIDESDLLSERAIVRRKSNGVELSAEDYPVDQLYIEQVCADSNVNFRYALKWKNAIVIDSKDENLKESLNFPFIRKISYVGKTKAAKNETPQFKPIYNYAKQIEINTTHLKPVDYGKSYTQVHQIRVDKLHQSGFDGKGVFMAIFDAGFFNVNVLSSYTRSRANMQLYSAYDLVDLDNELTDTDNHGTAVSSCVLAFDPSQYIGTGPNATVFLFRTENSSSEFPLEELNWCKAAELADSLGIRLVSSSLGYTRFDDDRMSYVHGDLDGKTSYISAAAEGLVKRGVVVVNSAGNEGDDAWLKIGSPSDVPSVISVGAVNGANEIGSFSSRGYNALGDIKPDVCAMGVQATVSSTYGSYYQGYGTSYSTPILSGGVACLLQAFPNKTPYEIDSAIRITASKNNQPDSLYGYGVANLHAAYLYLSEALNTPTLIDTGMQLLLYNDNFNQIHVKISSKKRFLLIFKRLKTISEYNIENNMPFTYLQLDRNTIDCGKKYTLRVQMESGVENYKLKQNDLSFCTP